MTAESQADRLMLVARAGRGVRTEARVVEWSPGPPTHLRPRFRPRARSLVRLDLSPTHIARPLRSAHTRARPPCLAPTRDSLDCAACPLWSTHRTPSSSPMAVAFWGRRHAPPLPLWLVRLLSPASPHVGPLCSLAGCAQNALAILGSGRPLWDEDLVRAKSHPLTHDAYSLCRLGP